MQGARKKIFLIVDRLPASTTAAVEAWLAERDDKIEMFYLPRRTPELNPDESLNNNIHSGVNATRLPDTQDELRSNIQRFLHKLAQLPGHIMSYFKTHSSTTLPELREIHSCQGDNGSAKDIASGSTQTAGIFCAICPSVRTANCFVIGCRERVCFTTPRAAAAAGALMRKKSTQRLICDQSVFTLEQARKLWDHPLGIRLGPPATIEHRPVVGVHLIQNGLFVCVMSLVGER